MKPSPPAVAPRFNADPPLAGGRRAHPGPPKKLSNTFNFYQKEKLEAVAREIPDRPMGDKARLVGRRWRALSDEEKRPYEDLAEEDRRRYRE